MLQDTCCTRGWCGKTGSCAFGKTQPLAGQKWCWKGHFSYRSYELSPQLSVWHIREMTHQMPAAVCSTSGKRRGVRHYKRGCLEVRSQQGENIMPSFPLPHRWMCGKESPQRVPEASHGGFVRHKADCHGSMLVPHRLCKGGGFPVDAWDTSLRRSRASGCPLLWKLLQDFSCPHQGWSSGSRGPRE